MFGKASKLPIIGKIVSKLSDKFMLQVHVVLKDLVRKSIGETEVASFFHYSRCFVSLALYDKHLMLKT